MIRQLLTPAAIAFTLITSAQLSPRTDAPLYRHMLEVNKQWSVMDPSLANDDRIVHFNNEGERIAKHLHLVRERLMAHHIADLPAAINEKRTTLLTRLDAYADRQRFPINEVLPYRNPVFIDPHGTACAVGQLMIESGRAELAQRIHNEMDLAYVHDMGRDDVTAWANANGFTEDELAWIQPGYPPNIPWAALGDGINGPVTELLRLSNNDLLVAGEFTNAGGVTVTNVARWDGSSYHAYGAGIDGEVDAAIEYLGNIYLGGAFNGGYFDLAKWNGTTWEYSTVFQGKSSHISDLCIHYGSLYAAGEAGGFVGNSCSVQRLSGGVWVAVGQQLNGVIRTMASLGDYLVCGGDFTGHGQAGISTDSTVMHVGFFNDVEWEQLADGLPGSVHALTMFNLHLYAGGSLLHNFVADFGLARLDVTWQPQMPNLFSYMSEWVGPAYIETLEQAGGVLYFGGSFSLYMGMVSGSQLGRYDGAPDAVSPIGAFDNPVMDLAVRQPYELIAGGSFAANSGLSVPHIASTDLALNVPTINASNARLRVWPNPASDFLHIELGAPLSQNTIIDVIDASGRIVITTSVRSSNKDLDVRAIQAGAYTVRIRDGNTIRIAPFVKH